MAFTPTTRKNSNNILFTFGSIIDCRLGVVNYLRKHKEEFDSQYLNYDYLDSDNEDYLKQLRMSNRELDPVKMCFKGKAKDSSEELYKQILEEYYEDVITYAPKTTMVHLIEGYYKFKIIKSTIVCRSTFEESFARDLFKEKANILLVKSYKDVDLSGFARLVVGDINDVLGFKKVGFLHIAVLDYVENFILAENPVTHKDEKLMLPYILLPLSDNNVFEIMNPYKINGGS